MINMINRLKLAAGVLAVVLCAVCAPAQTIYVSTNGLHDVGNNFDTWARASTNINEAVVLANSLVRNVEVSNGVYQLTNTIAMTSGFTLSGVNGYSNTFLKAQGQPGAFRVLTISNASAVVEGLTLMDGYHQYYGGGIYMTNGTVRNCEVFGCRVGVWVTSGDGGGIWMSGGL